jgi:hypothetical protein
MALYVCTSTWSGQPDRPQLNAVRAQFRICHDDALKGIDYQYLEISEFFLAT